MNIIILTKTNWNEAPRIRHQLTKLLKTNNNSIHFFEKNTSYLKKIKKRNEENISFYSHPELIHHQLRMFPFIQKMNNIVVKNNLKKILKNIDYDLIINFNYDYSFLNSITNSPIITFINDDFIQQGKPWMKTAITNQLKKTCSNSDMVLTVSYPLLDQLKDFNNNVKLFFPWAQNFYIKPKINEPKKVLYYGYISRLDWEIIEVLLTKTDYEYDFIGPIVGGIAEKKVAYLKSKYSNFNHHGFTHFKDLNRDVYFCSILPYDTTIPSVQKLTVSNRAFNLLSLGLPLVYADLKHLIKTNDNVIRKNKTLDDYIKSLNYFKNNFSIVQNDIALFLNDHYPKNRLESFNDIVLELNI